MNIGKLADATGVSPDTLRYSEKEGLIDPPRRGSNGYRHYDDAHVSRVRFVCSAQALGFSLAEIREVVPRLAAGSFSRLEIEVRLNARLVEIDAHNQQLQGLRQELQDTFAQLRCAPSAPVSFAGATRELVPSDISGGHQGRRLRRQGARPPATAGAR